MRKVQFKLLFFILFFSLSNSYGQNEKNQQSQIYLFTENKGQLMNATNESANEVLYYSKIGNVGIYICENKLYYVINKNKNSDRLNSENMDLPDERGNTETIRVEFKLANCNTNIEAIAEEESSFVSRFFLPSCPNGITTHNYKKVKLKNVYPGIDWVLYFNEIDGHTNFKYDFEVAPGADFHKIKLQYNGASKISKSDNGGLEIETLLGNIEDGKPVSYLIESKKQVKSSFNLSNQEIGFDVNNYNKNEKLIIDPTVLWSTYFGYNGEEHGRAITVGDNGFIYTGGFTNSSNFPVLNGYSSPYHEAFDAYVMKLTPEFEPLWITYYGGSLADVCRTLEVDSAGNVFAGMETRSGDMPTFNAYQPVKNDTDDFFILKLNPEGLPIWASFYGGNNLDALRRIKLSHLGYMVVSGYSRSTDFPMINPIQANNAGDADAVIMKVNMESGFPIWSTYFGGTGYDEPVGITLDNNNNILIVGTTMSIDFPVQNAFQSVRKGISDIFVLKLNSNLTTAWSTYIGSTMEDDGNGIAVDTAGNCFILGTSKKNNYPMLNAWQPVYKSPSDAVITKFNANGGLMWSTYAGGPGTEDGNSIAVDNSGNVLATGFTLSNAFPLVNATQQIFGGQHDAFILRFSNKGACLMSTYFGGNGIEHSRSIATDNTGNLYIAGSTTSTNLITVSPIQSANGSSGNSDADAFLLKINYSLLPKPSITVNGQNPKCSNSDLVELVSSSIIGNSWSNGEFTPSISTSLNGNYLVTVYDSTGIGISSDAVSINNNPIVSAGFDSVAINYLRMGSIINLSAPLISNAIYNWTGPNGFNSSINNPQVTNIQHLDLGLYTCEVTVGSCTKIIKKINLLNFLNSIAPSNTNYSGATCQGQQITLFTDSIPGAEFLWSGPNGFTATTRNVSLSNVQLNNAGLYSVKWLLDDDESLPATVSVVIYEQPISNAGQDLIACNGNNFINIEGEMVSGGIGTWTCTTAPHAIIQNPNNPNSLVTNLKAGTNQLKWTVANGTCVPAFDIALIKYTTASNFGCIKPSNLNQIVNGTSATLSWSTCTIAEQFQIRITLNNVNSNINTTNYLKTFNNLSPGSYTWKVRPKCNGIWGPYSSAKTFVITTPRIESDIESENNNLKLFPNPVSDQLNISFEIKSMGEYKIEMIDLLGRVLISETNEFDKGNWSENFNTIGLSSGIFFIRLTGTDNTNLINKFVKE